MTAPRLHVLTALASSKAVVLRRGPSGQVASLGWDRQTGVVVLGQWLAGRIYEYRCDLSPDGRHMVYFATQQGRQDGPVAWTAVSRAPWLRAIHFVPQGSTWGGGGAFTADGMLWTGTIGDATLADGLRLAPSSAFPHATDGVSQGDTYGTKLILRGWRHLGGASYQAAYSRDLPGGGALEHGYAVGSPQRAIISSVYRVIQPGMDRVTTDWEWADLWRDQLQFAAKGALWQAAISPDGKVGPPRLLHDFSALQFQALRAPYDGVTP